jgi:hypothetical protein
MEQEQPKLPPEPEREGSDVYVSIKPTPDEIKRVMVAYDAGDCDGYRQGVKDAVFIMFIAVSLSLMISSYILGD